MPERPDLGDVPIFKHLDAEEQTELEELLEPASFEAGEMIFDEGGPEERLYVITAGTVEVCKRVLPGRRQRLATVEAPSVVGEMRTASRGTGSSRCSTLTPQPPASSSTR